MRLGVFLAVFTSWAATAAAQQFYSEIKLPAPVNARAVAAGDLDGDGYDDLVVVRGGSFTAPACSVYFNDGWGNLTAPISVAPGGAAYDVKIGDVTGDGLPDLVIAIYTPPAISVVAGDGEGGFDSPRLFKVPIAMPLLVTLCVELADVDGDGRLDAIAGNSQGAGASGNQLLSVFLADRIGGFLPPVEASPGFVTTDSDLAVGLFDADAELDIVSSGALLPGNGSGGFGPPVALGLPAADGLASGDLNMDGQLDIVEVDDASTNNLRVVLSDGLGGFGTPQVYTVSSKPVQVEIADMDGDGRLDVVTGNQGSGTGSVTILHGDGSGGLGNPTTLTTGGGFAGTRDLVLADFDHNGHLDIAALNPDAATLSIYMQTDGTLGLATPLAAGSVTQCSAVALADLDADGDLDAVTSRASSAGTETSLVRWLNDGSGGLSSPVAYTVFGPQEDVATGDLDGDGAPDVVASLSLLDAVAVLRGDGLGGLLPATLYPAGDEPGALALGDVDGDGALDVVTANRLSHDVSVLFGDGAGALGPPSNHFVGGLAPGAVALGHLDLDGALDAVTANSGSQSLSVLLGDGAGGFLAPSTLPVDDVPGDLAIGDLDGDGAFDLVTGDSTSSGTLSVWLGDGAGGLDPELLLPGSYAVTGIALGDLNGDGRPDLVAVHGSNSRIGVRLGIGNGNFSPSLTTIVSGASGVALGDMNGDERLDLVVSQRSSNGVLSISVIRNESLPHPWHDLGHGLYGLLGAPALVGTGTLVAGTPGALKLSHAQPNRPAALVISHTSTPTSFKGGVLVPVPPLISLLLTTSAQGQIPLSWLHWAGGAPGTSWYFQYAVSDPFAPNGVALSNALRAELP